MASLTSGIPVVNRLFHDPPILRFDKILYVWALAELGPVSKPAIPALERLSSQGKGPLSLSAQAALIRIRGEKVEPYVAAYRQFFTSNSAAMAFVLMELGPYAKEAAPAFWEGMQSTNEKVRHLAAFALPRVAGGRQDLKPEELLSVGRMLNDDNDTTRILALNSLGDFGPLVSAALPQVRQSLFDTNALARAAALRFFDKVLSVEEFLTVRDEVLKAQLDPEPLVRNVARRVLARGYSSK